MIIRKRPALAYSQVTPKSVYLNRRRFLARSAALFGPAAALLRAGKLDVAVKSPFSTTEKLTPYKDITTYSNFYEFGTGKDQPSRNATHFNTSRWKIKVEGQVNKPRTFDMDAILRLAPLEERIYRHRCVEAWSIVVPWIGFPLNALLKEVEPNAKAKFVAFQSFYDPGQMSAGAWAGIPFPYVEGLRIDEAMNPLTILCTGLYGETLPNQNGAPVRLVVP